jgi:catechol 2,3-dioxygenase-like lactoylglutathione lyase family enzyme
MLMRIQSVIIHCSDLARSIAFYRDRLGFPVKRLYEDQAEFHCGPVSLVLRLANPAQPSPQPSAATPRPGFASPGLAQISFEVLDLDAFYAEKKNLGVEFALPPAPPSSNDFGKKLAVLLDPDGFPIAVFQHLR